MESFNFKCVGCDLSLAASDEIIGVFVRCDSCDVKQEVIRPVEPAVKKTLKNNTISIKTKPSAKARPVRQAEKKSKRPLIAALMLVAGAAGLYLFISMSSPNVPRKSTIIEEYTKTEVEAPAETKIEVPAETGQVALTRSKPPRTPGAASPLLVKKMAEAPVVVSQSTRGLLGKYCVDCHDDETQKGDVRLDNLADLNIGDRLDLLNRIQEQVYIGEMPPKKKKKQPSESERRSLVSSITLELNKHNASKLAEKIRRPEYGNYVNHDDLFSGKYEKLKPFTEDRRWLISEFIFNAKVNKLVDHNPSKTIDGKRENVIGDNNRRVNVTNPFLLPTNSGVRYYANETLNGGHLLTMITNAKELATYMIYQTNRNSRYLPAATAIMALENSHKSTLAKRKKFLDAHIDSVCKALFKSKNDNLLPRFSRVKIQATKKPKDGKPIKKAAFHAANPGKTEMTIIYMDMKKHLKDGMADEKIIEMCEKTWFFAGHNERKIRSRVVFMKGYMPDIKKNMNKGYGKNAKPAVYKKPPATDFKIYTAGLLKHRQKGDHYNQIIDKCMAEWESGFKQARIKVGPPKEENVKGLVEQLFVKVFERQPTALESSRYSILTKTYIKDLGNEPAIEKLIQTLILRSEFVYRSEFGQGSTDQFGRRTMSPRDASYALAYALTDSSPDKELTDAAKNGKLKTREDYQREVTRLLKNRQQFYVIDESVQNLQFTGSLTNTPIRQLRFFREFFGYPNMLSIFKDDKRFGSRYDGAKGRLVGEADRLVDYILQNDKDVFKELLTTDKFYVYHSGDNKAIKASSDRIREIYNYFKDKGWQDFKVEDLAKHAAFIDKVKMRGVDTKRLKKDRRYNPLASFQRAMTSFTDRLGSGQKAAAPYPSFPSHGPSNGTTRAGLQLRSPEVGKFFNIDFGKWDYPTTQPAKVANRRGMLTHPAWLIAHAQNTETDPVKRGKWIREKLLAGTIPDVPITVDAVIPEDHHKTLRTRLVGVTEKPACWKCHERMNPLGYAFETYDDFGVYRTKESLEHPDNLIKEGKLKQPLHVDGRSVYKTLPVDARGYLKGTGDAKLDGEVKDAIDLTTRLSRSVRVRQSIIRYAFRYFMGRNEVLSDSKTLIDADKAYMNGGGSFDAVIVSLLTSDSFIYRKAVKE